MVDAFEQKFVGKITAVNSEVDAATRNIAVQATLANPDETLRSGMFVRVDVQLKGDRKRRSQFPPRRSPTPSYGNSVYVVEKIKGKRRWRDEFLGVRQQFVKLGATPRRPRLH